MSVRVKSLLLVNCGQLLTMGGDRGPRAGHAMGDVGMIRHGALLIRGSEIVAAGPTRQVIRSPEAKGADLLDVRGRVVLPGFADSHTHALFPASRVDEYVARIGGRTYEQIAKAGGGILATARRLRALTERELARKLERTLPLFLRHGTTTVEVKSGYGLEAAQELKMLKAIRAASANSPVDVVPTLLAHAVPARFARRRRRYIEAWRRRLIPRTAGSGLAECFDVFCDRGFFTFAESAELLRAARDAGLRLKVHGEQLTRSGVSGLAASLGALSVDHLDRLSATDIRALRGTGTIATLLPGSVLHLASGAYPPARRLIEGGVPVALATNFNPGSSPTVSMQMILSLACSQMRLSPEEALTAATINGAYALGRGDRIGSFEPGKQADVIIMDLDDYREIPYYFGINHCAVVIKKGRIVYKRG